jgi:hypothetical protein
LLVNNEKIILDNAELEYNIFQSINKESRASNNQIENNSVLIHGGIIADANIPLVTYLDILTKSYNILHYHQGDMVKALTKKMIIKIYYNMWKIAEK